jgi:hypothetical protein
VGAAEGAFRLAGTRVAASMDGFYEPFGAGSYKMAPHAHAFMNWYPEAFSVETDDLGLRIAGSAAPAAEPRRIDVLILGDSQAFGQGLDYEQSIGGRFQAVAAKSGVQVSNAAVAGHFLLNQIAMTRWLIEEKHIAPRAVLVLMTPRMLANPTGDARATVYQGMIFGSQPTRSQLARKWLSGNSAVYLVCRNAIHNLTGSADLVTPVLDLYRQGPSAARERDTIAGLHSLQDVLRQAGSPPIVVCYLPLAMEPRVEEIAAKKGTTDVKADVPARSAAAAARAVGARLIDLTPTLTAAAAAGEKISLQGDPHYGSAFSDRAGRAIWDALDWPALTAAPSGR